MRRVTVLVAVLLAFGVMLFAGRDAHSGLLPGIHSASGVAPANLVVRVKSEKQKQRQMNKDCGPGKVSVDGRCVKRENAEKKEEKANKNEAPPPGKKSCGALFSVNCADPQ